MLGDNMLDSSTLKPTEQGDLRNPSVNEAQETLKGALMMAVKTSGTAFALDGVVGELSSGVEAEWQAGQVVSQATSTLAQELLTLKSSGHQLATTASGSLSRIREIQAQIEKVSHQVESSSGRAGDTLEAASHLDQGAVAITNISELVRRLSTQLKILAINASIEAARAGVHGSGFGVVAREMGKLSEQTAAAMVQVDSVTAGLRDSIARVYDAAAATHREMDLAAGATLLAKQELGDVAGTVEGWLISSDAVEDSLGRQTGAVAQLNEQVGLMVERTGMVREQVHQAGQLAASLHGEVDELLRRVGSVRLDWQTSALEALLEIARGMRDSTRGEMLVTALRQEFLRFPWFELFYVMDARGVQITENINNPASGGMILEGQRGVSRADRPYFQGALASDAGYVSPVYLSSATRDFCLTVSCSLTDSQGRIWGVLAGDVKLSDLASIQA